MPVTYLPDSLKMLEGKLVEEEAEMASSTSFGMETIALRKQRKGQQGASLNNREIAVGGTEVAVNHTATK